MNSLIQDSLPFLEYLANWQQSLPVLTLQQAMPDPLRTAILSVDVTNGFCYEGALASPRVAKIVAPITRLFQSTWAAGLRQIVLLQDTHEPDAVEFAQWPPHCVRGTREAEAVPEFQALPFFDQLVIFPKNSIQAALNSDLAPWLDARPELDTFIVTGDCTDLCTYQLAMHLRLHANAYQVRRRVILPANCCETYDIPLQVAQSVGALPHPGDLTHAMFLHHMALNGVEIIQEIA
jgi:nicotinamidase-related amidase